jgi:hypothetical protein
MRTILLLFFVAVAMIAWRNIKQENQAPPPGQFTGAAIVYAICGLMSEVIGGLGVVLAVAWTLGLALNVINSNAPLPAKPTPIVIGKQPGDLPKKG